MTYEAITEWFTAHLPKDLFTGAPAVSADGDEILVIGPIATPDKADAATVAGAVKEFRDRTREARMKVAAEAENLFNRKVSWGVRAGEDRHLFTSLSIPVMTRLRLPERATLDTLVETGVARSRSDALAWCVRLVGKHEADWLNELREALVHVQKVREEGPKG